MNYIISASSKVYDHQGAFDRFGFIDWRQGRISYNIGDVIYIYQGAPLKKISHKTVVTAINKDFSTIQNDREFFHSEEEYEKGKLGKYMRLVLEETIESDTLNLLDLMNNGLKGAPQGPVSLDNEDKSNLKKFIEIAFMNADTNYPETAETANCIIEGAVKTVLVNKYERSAEARSVCISHFGAICKVCNMNFKDTYGELGNGFIHVHHIKPLSEIKEGYVVDPIKDLIPVCPNCHAMLHKKINGKNVTAEELSKNFK